MKDIKSFTVIIGAHPPFVVEAKDLKDAKRKASYYKYVNNIKGTYKVKWLKK